MLSEHLIYHPHRNQCLTFWLSDRIQVPTITAAPSTGVEARVYHVEFSRNISN